MSRSVWVGGAHPFSSLSITAALSNTGHVILMYAEQGIQREWGEIGTGSKIGRKWQKKKKTNVTVES